MHNCELIIVNCEIPNYEFFLSFLCKNIWEYA